MREATEAMTKFVWSMTAFGMQQMLAMARTGGRQSGPTAADGFDDLSRAMECRLGEAFGEMFRVGDRMQRSVTDAMFSATTGGGSAGGRPTGDCGCGGSDAPPTAEPAGWGPMPPA